MRTFERRQNQPRKPLTSDVARPDTARLRPVRREHPALDLQRTIGNQAVLRLLQTQTEKPAASSPRFEHDLSPTSTRPPAAGAGQTKLTLSQPGDEYEQEADRISEHVAGTHETQLQQTKRVPASDSGQTAVPPVVHEVLRSPGRPLDPAARLFMEPRFGLDLSQVRLHTDAKAAESAQAIEADAYTVGQDIVFGAGQFNPRSSDGRRLIAHELTHVVQHSQSVGHGQHISRQPKKGKVVRVEHGRFSRRPPGPGAYTQDELNKWYDLHPKASSAGGANLVNGERTKDEAYTHEALWKKGYYYAKSTYSEDSRQAWETWLNDEGDGKVITIFVKYNK